VRPILRDATEPVIGPRFARTRWRHPQDEVGNRGAKPDPHGEEARKRRLEP